MAMTIPHGWLTAVGMENKMIVPGLGCVCVPPALVLHSSKAIGKEATTIARRLGWASPHPGFGPQIELSSRDARGLFNLGGSGKTLSCQRITPEEAPPAFLQIEPACPSRNEDVVNARMLLQPGAGLQAGVTAEVVRDDKDLPSRIVGFNVGRARQCSLWNCARRHSGSTPCHRAHASAP